MPFRMPILALCFSTFVAPACGGVANAQAPTGQSAAPVISFPPNYKARLASLLASEYAYYGEGQPQISNVHNGSGPIGGSVSVCVQYPYKNKYRPMSADGMHHVLIFGEKSVLTLGQAVFKKKRWTDQPGVRAP